MKFNQLLLYSKLNCFYKIKNKNKKENMDSFIFFLNKKNINNLKYLL